MAAQAPVPEGVGDSGRRSWLLVTALVALGVSLLDAALLERKEGLFRGGFLALDPLDTAGRRLAFGVTSFLADAAVAGVLAALGFWLARKLRLHRPAALATASVAAAGPLVVADVVQYQLIRYVGDAMDLALMFDLVGGRPGEFFAVAGPHLVLPVAVLLVATALVVFSVAWLQRRGGGASAGARAMRGVGWRSPMAVLLLGTLVLTIARLQSSALDNGLRRKPSGNWLGQLVTLLTDFDRDGYGLLGRPPDPAPFDSRIYPYAVEVPGNGVDENGVGGDLPVDWPAYAESPGTAPSFVRRPDVVLIVLESFRADVVGTTIRGREVTPVLDALGRRGISLQRAYSHNGYTSQSRFHLMSGSLVGLRGGTTLVDDFQANGYEVAYISGQDESFGGARFQVGFDRADYRYDARQDPGRRYSTFTTAGSLAVPLDVVEERVREYLERRSPDRPMFLYVNFHDTHFPYHHRGVEPMVSDLRVPRSQISPERMTELYEMYANTAANVDAAVGRVLEAVERRTGKAPAVVVTADHGESLYEEGFLGHGYALNDVQTRVPLIAVGLSLHVSEPFGHVELRDAIREALSGPDEGGPRLQERTGKVVFQYLGSTIARARAIAELSQQGRTGFDLRMNRASVDESAGLAESSLNGAARRTVAKLIHDWEAMAVAQAGQRSEASGAERGGAAR